jgi:hypothetical protein
MIVELLWTGSTLARLFTESSGSTGDLGLLLLAASSSLFIHWAIYTVPWAVIIAVIWAWQKAYR